MQGIVRHHLDRELVGNIPDNAKNSRHPMPGNRRKRTKQIQTPICDVQDGNEMRSRMKVK